MLRHVIDVADPTEAILTIPGILPSLNQLTSGKRRDAIGTKEEWKDWAWKAWLAEGQPRYQRPEVWVRIFFPDARRRDWSNYAGGGVKHIIDALTEAGAWPDDNDQVMQLHRPELLLDKDDPRVEVIVRERREQPT